MKKFPQTPSFNLTGKRALVTGASSGIGLGCAIALAEKGAEVTLASRSTKNLFDVNDYIISKGWKSKVLTLDITNVQETSRSIIDNDISAKRFMPSLVGFATGLPPYLCQYDAYGI